MSTTALTHTTHPPLPPVLPSWNPLGHVLRFRSDPLGLFTEGRELGDVVRMRVGFFHINAVYSADAAARILIERQPNYVKQTRGYQQLRRILGQGLLTAEGAHWKRQRRIAQPAFNHRRVAAFADSMERATLDLADRWALQAGQIVDVAEAMNRLTLRIAGETLFSLDISGESDEVGTALSDMLGGFIPTITNPLLTWFPSPARTRMRRGKDTLDRVVREIIARRRAQDPRGENTDDLLGMFMAARDEDGQGMSDEQLRDEVLTMLLAGHETTANALAWTFWHLANAPEATQKLHEELDALSGPLLESYPRLTWTGQVLDESMRLTPPAWVESRMAVEADVIDGFHIPAGSFVFIPQFAIHRSPKYWHEPLRFDPTRFGPGPHTCPDGSPRPKQAFLPFGDGQRKCIGEHFAKMEARIVLSTLARRFRLEALPGQTVGMEPTVTLRPRDGLPLRVVAR